MDKGNPVHSFKAIPASNFLILILFYFVGVGFSQSNGTTIYNFLNTPYSARSTALAGNLGLYQAGVDAQLENPAGILDLDSAQLSINYSKHYLDFYGGNLSFAFSPKPWGRVGVGILYFNYGDFEETDELGAKTGTNFSASELAILATYANRLSENVNFGVNLKFISSNLASYSSYGLALDMAFDWNPGFLNQGKILFSMTNAGTQLTTYDGFKEKIPLSFRIGISHKPQHLPITIAVMLKDLNYKTDKMADRVKKFVVSAEFNMSRYLAVRLGYDNQKRIDLAQTGSGGVGGVSLGFGVKVRKFRIDYAISLMNALGNIHSFGVVWDM